MLFTKLFSKQKESVEQEKRAAIYRNLLKKEAAIGGTLFGPVPAGGRREFFCLDETTWVWHEEWTDAQGKKQIRNTRYDIRPTGILKAQNGQGYHMVSLEEARHLQTAIRVYLERVKKEVYAGKFGFKDF